MRILTQFSGGWDSVAVACLLLEQGHKVHPVFYDYEQRYCDQEIDAVQYADTVLTEKYGIKFMKPLNIEIVSMRLSQRGTNEDYIPMRNLVLGAHSVNLALSKGITRIAVGNKTVEVRPHDPWSFADCSQTFFSVFSSLVQIGSEDRHTAPEFIMPLIGMPKSRVAEILRRNNIDVHQLWSCYSDSEVPCGTCYHCKENAMALKQTKH